MVYQTVPFSMTLNDS